MNEAQREFLSYCMGMWFNTRTLCGKPTIDEVIETFIQVEDRMGQVMWGHGAFSKALRALRVNHQLSLH